MHQDFSVVSIHTRLLDKSITIELNLDVDSDSVKQGVLVLSEKEANKITSFDIEAKGRLIKLSLTDWPVPNKEYLLKIQKGITSIVGDILPDSLMRSLVFRSEITSEVAVLSPSNHEEIEEVNLSWVENLKDGFGSLVNSYYLEISTENIFYNIIKSTNVYGNSSISMGDIPPGQYFLRIRAQKDSQYGQWSDVISFIIAGKNGNTGALETDPSEDEDDFSPVFEEELEILSLPENGVTPKSFIIEFDEELDPSAVAEIVILRRTI